MIKLAKNRMSFGAVLGAVLLMIGQVVASLYLPNLTSDLVNDGIAKGDTAYIWHVGVLMLGVSLASVIFAFGNVFLAARTSQTFGKNLRSDIYKKVLYASHDEFDQLGTSSLITRTTNDVVQIQNVTMMALRMMIMAPITLIGASIMAYQKDARLTQIFIFVIPILLVVFAIIMFFAVPMFKAMQTKTDNLNLIFREGLTGVRVIRAFIRDKFEQQRFDVANVDYTNNARRVFSIMSAMFPLMTLIMSGTNISIIWLGGHLIANQAMEIGNMIAFMTYAMQILISFMMLSMVFVFVPRGQASAGRVQEVLALNRPILENPHPVALPKITPTLTLKQLVFRYDHAEHPALEGVNAEVKAGETLAIIGGTGSGKTTLINLIPRFYDLESGTIQLNGCDISQLPLKTLHQAVSLVPQKAVLLRGTIRDNLTFGRPEASDDDLWHALEIAQAADFVRELEDGLDSTVEQGGGNFSGGQRQRLAIARALVKQAVVYIFDDSFSALDFKTDAKLRAALQTDPAMAQAIVVIVGQRVSTVAGADQIIVLDEGHMVGIGTHQELMANNETYQEIVASQLKKEGADHGE